VILAEVAEGEAVEVVFVGGVAERAVVGVMGRFDADAATGTDEAVKFLHGADDVCEVLDDVDGAEVIESAVGKGVREMVEVAEDVGGAGGVEIDADCAGEFADAAADVESSQVIRVSASSYHRGIVKWLLCLIFAGAVCGQDARAVFCLRAGRCIRSRGR